MESANALPPTHVLETVIAHLKTSLEATLALSRTLYQAERLGDVVAARQHYETARAALVASSQVLAEWLPEQA